MYKAQQSVCSVLCKASCYRKTEVLTPTLCAEDQYSRGETVFTCCHGALSPLSLCLSEWWSKEFQTFYHAAQGQCKCFRAFQIAVSCRCRHGVKCRRNKTLLHAFILSSKLKKKARKKVMCIWVRFRSIIDLIQE